MQNKHQYFSIEMKVVDEAKFREFIGQFTNAMVDESQLGGGHVIACGWGEHCGSMTACDAYEEVLSNDGYNPDDIVKAFLTREGLL